MAEKTEGTVGCNPNETSVETSYDAASIYWVYAYRQRGGASGMFECQMFTTTVRLFVITNHTRLSDRHVRQNPQKREKRQQRDQNSQ
jgi:hypothetical protein